MAKDIKTPYSGAKRLIPPGNLPTWMNEYDAQRIASYGLYEDIYWSEPLTFKIIQRGTEENPIYIPSGRIITNTMDRYTGRGWAPTPDPDFGTSEEQAAAMLWFRQLIRRERLGSNYESNKLYGIMRGDWCFYITANMDKPVGSRISLKPIDPREVFPINDEDDVERILGYDIVEQITEGDDLRIKRTRYLKNEHEDHPAFGNFQAPISYQVDVLEIEGWEGDGEQPPKVVRTEQAPVLLPAGIMTLPIYHIKNFEEPNNPFGSSEMRGIERLMAGINQSITDEELTLALHGLGMYKSEKGQPRDANGNLTTWQLGPGRVVHDETFDRVTGVTTVTPYLDHIKYLEDRMNRVSGASDVAQGVVDVTVAESGVALALRMGPIMDSAKKKDTTIEEVMNNMLFDLRSWAKAYDGVDMSTVEMNSVFDAKLPANNKERFDWLVQMYTATPPLITGAYFRDAVREMGMAIPMDVDGAAIVAEQAAIQALLDPYAGRLNEGEEEDVEEEEPEEEEEEV